MNNSLNEVIKAACIRAGADDLGVASADELLTICNDANIESFLDGAKNVVVALVADPPGITDAVSNKEYFMLAYAGYQRADAAIFSVSELLNRKGYRTHSIVRSMTTAKDSSGRMRKTIPLKAAAQASGLGKIGLSSLLITPEFGPRVRLAGIITDAPLDTGVPMINSVCDNCGACAKACPSGAIGCGGKEGFMRCSAYIFGGVNIDKLQKTFSESPGEALSDAIGGLTNSFAGWMGSLSEGRRLHYNCGKCIQVCRAYVRFAKNSANQNATGKPKKAAAKKSAGK